MLILTGALMTIVSALLVHYIVAENMKEVSALGAKNDHLQSTIENFWQSSDRVERNLNTALVLLGGNSPDLEIISELYDSSGHNIDGVEFTAESIRQTTRDYRRDIIAKINDIYSEQQELSEERRIIEEENAFYTNLALFLQVFGLMLVLSRDLGIKD